VELKLKKSTENQSKRAEPEEPKPVFQEGRNGSKNPEFGIGIGDSRPLTPFLVGLGLLVVVVM